MRFPIVLALIIAGCASRSVSPGSNEDALSLAAAESAFAAHSVREDMRVAFLANFAADGVYVRKGWTLANPDLAGRAAPPIVLDWRPVHTEVAASGDMGLSTGPWKLTSKSKPGEPASFGQFVSVWRREPGGPWKVAVDIGISNPRDSLWDAALDARRSGTALPRGETAIDGIEGRFASEMRSGGPRAAYARFASTRIRFYRDGADPVAGRDAALAALETRELVWTVERSEVARSGDFAYARGRYAAASAPGKVLGYFLRVWRPEDGDWRIVMDVANPAG